MAFRPAKIAALGRSTASRGVVRDQIQSIWSSLSGRVWSAQRSQPRHIQEQNDLYVSLLALTHLQLLKQQQQRHHDELSPDALFEKAVRVLEEERGIHTLSVGGLRAQLQTSLLPQVRSLMEAFHEADQTLVPEKEDTSICQRVLLQEYAQVSRDLTDEGNENETPFLRRKQGALQTILSYHGWMDSNEDTSKSKSNDDKEIVADDFGYHGDPSQPDILKAIRHHQMINLAKTSLLRDGDLGFGMIALASGVEGAGRGVYVDGMAPAGSLMAFFPGKVWLKEHLLSDSVYSQFQRDPLHQLSSRYDEHLIDSRISPYTVLNGDRSNPFAIAHIANHPSSKTEPNCQTVMIDFKNASDRRYIPNTYAKPPLILGSKMMEEKDNEVFMHGFGLIASRDLINEELFYDYRLSPANGCVYPPWYHVCDPDQVENRWYHQNKK